MNSTLLDLLRRGASLRDFDITDIHGHIGRYEFPIPDISLAGLVAAMNRTGVARVLVSHMRCMSAHAAWGNEEVLRAIRAWPGRILGYVSFWPADADTVRAEAEKCLAAGFIGLKLHNSNGFPYDDPAYAPAYAMANERRMPALFHTWGGDKEFAEIRRLADRYPEISFLLAHAGSANEDGYSRIARECPNVYLELALSRSPRGLVARFVNAVGADKIVWGSDVYFLDQAPQLGKVIGARISEEDKCKILSGNARRLLERVRR